MNGRKSDWEGWRSPEHNGLASLSRSLDLSWRPQQVSCDPLAAEWRMRWNKTMLEAETLLRRLKKWYMWEMTKLEWRQAFFGWIVSLQNSKVEVLTPHASECDLSWRESVGRGHQGKVRSLACAWPSMTGVLIKGGNLGTETHRRVYTAISQGTLKTACRLETL